MIAIARSAASRSLVAISTVPSSSTLMRAPVESTIDRMVLPPGPITLRIWSMSILIWKMRGAYGEISARGSAIARSITSSSCRRPRRACSSACSRIARLRPETLMSIWRAVIPCAGAGDLEVHVAVVVLLAGDVGQDREAAAVRHQAHGDAGHRRLIGTPASISASDPPHTEAIDDEPFDSRMSETTRIV